MSIWTATDAGYRTRLHRGQGRATRSTKRFVVVLAGTQSGKTSYGPLWLKREIDRCGPGDYLAVTASYDLFKLKMLPALRECFEHVYGIGRYWSGDRVIELADPATGLYHAKRADDPMWGRIILRSAESGGGLESNTAKAAWCDEAGMESFQLDTWEAVQRRLSLNRGRVLFTTTIYDLGWLKLKLYDPWERAGGNHPEIDVIQFDSTENPAFPVEEYERARAEMPAWKFDMFYRGRYARPAGLIYDSFDEQLHLSPRFVIPDTWQRFMGLDFGGVNTAATFYAEHPESKKLYLYRTYKAGGRSAAEHTYYLLKGEPMIPFCVGGSASEGQWRREFRMGGTVQVVEGGTVQSVKVPGLPVSEPDIKLVEVGIDRVYAARKRGELIVFDDLHDYLDQLRSYRRKVDANGEPTETIEAKHSAHYMDCDRYIIGRIRRG